MGARKILISSVLVFLVINTVENYIHYTIGRNHLDSNKYAFQMPSSLDFFSMLITMVVFAGLQAVGTVYLSEW